MVCLKPSAPVAKHPIRAGVSEVERIGAGGNTRSPDPVDHLVVHLGHGLALLDAPGTLDKTFLLAIEFLITQLLGDNLSDVTCSRPVAVSDLTNDAKDLFLVD